MILLGRERARRILRVLEANGIDCRLSDAGRSSLAYVDVNEKYLKRSVNIIESLLGTHIAGNGPGDRMNNILIPVDLSDKGLIGCRVGFELANRLKARPKVMYSYVVPNFEKPIAFVDQVADDETALMVTAQVKSLQEDKFNKFAGRIRAMQMTSELATTPFDTEIHEGLPEEVILDLAKHNNPKLIVMATREASRRSKDLVGSVTGEVLDSCRVPLFTVPENYDFPGIAAIRKISFFCNLDNSDLISMEAFLSLFDYPDIDVTLIPVTDRFGKDTQRKVEQLRDRFSASYPSATFIARVFPSATFRKDFQQFCEEGNLELIVVQNKKKNIFKRLINPGIAHVIFFERDVPMIVIPV